MASPLQNVSNDLAAAAEAVASSVVAVHAQHRIPSSGIQWRKDVIVTVNHGIRRSEGISVLLGLEKSVAATVAGRDPSTDLAILRSTSCRIKMSAFTPTRKSVVLDAGSGTAAWKEQAVTREGRGCSIKLRPRLGRESHRGIVLNPAQS